MERMVEQEHVEGKSGTEKKKGKRSMEQRQISRRKVDRREAQL